MNLLRRWRRPAEVPVTPRIEPPMPRVRWGDVAAQAATAPAAKQGAHSFVMPKPAPGVLPAGVTDTIAQDEQIVQAYGWVGQGLLNAGYGWLGYTYLAELTQVPEYRRGSEIIAKEMTRKWIRLTARGEDDKADKLRLLDAAMKKFKVRDRFRRAAELDGWFGRGQLYFDTGATDKPDELKTPLVLRKEKIGLGSLKRIGVIEPLWTYPGIYNSNDPLRDDFYNPETWYVQGKQVHRSRLLTFVGREVPDLLKPAYVFGGLSLTQIARPYVDNWIRTRTSVSDLIHSFSTMVLHTDMQVLLQPAGLDGLLERVQAFNNFRTNRGLMVVNKDTEDLSNVSTPLGSLDHLQAQSQEFIASVQGIPLVVLLGVTPSGLNASSDGELRAFYAWVHAQQEDMFADQLQRTIEIIQLSEFGTIDPDIGFEFIPLWQLDEAGQAAVRKTNADTDAVYIEAGVVSPEEIRDTLAADPDGRYMAVDFSAPPPEPPEQPDDLGAETNDDPAETIAAASARGSAGGAAAANAG